MNIKKWANERYEQITSYDSLKGPRANAYEVLNNTDFSKFNYGEVVEIYCHAELIQAVDELLEELGWDTRGYGKIANLGFVGFKMPEWYEIVEIMNGVCNNEG